MILADKIIDLRKKNGWSQEELAEKLGVSRQAVSKWESAQAIPDLGRVLAMRPLLGDDGLPPARRETKRRPLRQWRTARRTATFAASAWKKRTPSSALAGSRRPHAPGGQSVRAFTDSDADDSLPHGRRTCGGRGQHHRRGVLLLLVVAAVVIFLRQGMESKEYEYLEQEDIETAYGVSGMVKEKQAAYRETCTRGIIVGVVLCILSAIPVLLGTLAADSVAARSASCCRACRCCWRWSPWQCTCLSASGWCRGRSSGCWKEGDYTREGKRAGTFADCADLLVPGDGGVSGVELYHDGMGADVDCLACRGCAVRGGSGYHPDDP